MALRLQSVPARQGIAWVRLSFGVFARRPMAFSLIFSGYLMVALLVSVLLPLVGSIVMLMCVPLLGLAYMRATQATLRQEPMPWAGFLEPVVAASPQRRSLLKLCALFAAAMTVLMLLLTLMAGEALRHWQELMMDSKATAEQLEAAAADHRIRNGVWLFLGGSALIAIPFWHAPALVQWCRQGVAQALFSSTLACWRNKGAFLIYGLAWFVVISVFGLVLNLVFTLIGAPQMALVATMPATLMFTTVFYISMYFTFVDSFVLTEDPVSHEPVTPSSS